MLDISKEDLFVIANNLLPRSHCFDNRVEAIRRSLDLLPGDTMHEALAKELLSTWHIREFVNNLKDDDAVEFVIEDLIDAVEKDTGVRLKFSTIQQPDTDDEPF